MIPPANSFGAGRLPAASKSSGPRWPFKGASTALTLPDADRRAPPTEVATRTGSEPAHHGGAGAPASDKSGNQETVARAQAPAGGEKPGASHSDCRALASAPGQVLRAVSLPSEGCPLVGTVASLDLPPVAFARRGPFLQGESMGRALHA
jgi:hypothetical protein